MMCDMGEDADFASTDLSTLCEGLQYKLKEIRGEWNDTKQELADTKEHFTNELKERDTQIAELQEALANEIEHRKMLQEKSDDAHVKLVLERQTTARLRKKVQGLEAEILKLDEQKRQRILRCVQMMGKTSREGMLHAVFLQMRRILAVERLTRIMETSDSKMTQEIVELRFLKEKIDAELYATQGTLENTKRRNDQLVVARRELAERILWKLNPDKKGRLKMSFHQWVEILPILAMENMIERMEAEIVGFKANIEDLEYKLETEEEKKLELEQAFENHIIETKKKRMDSLLGNCAHIIKLRVAHMIKLRDHMEQARRTLFKECEEREQHIMMMERLMRDDPHTKALDKHCHELEWQLEQSLKGPPSRVVKLDQARLCGSCSRQVVFQDYMAMADKVDLNWKVPLMRPVSERTNHWKTPTQPNVKFHKTWVP